MNKYWERWFPVIIIVVALLNGCTDPTFVGSVILDGDRVNAAFTDTITIRSRTIRGDSLLTYSPSPVWLNSYLFGHFKDPLFGSTVAEIYAQPTLEVSSISYLSPDFEGSILDSVILVLPYTGSGFYGNTEQQFALEIYELADSLSRNSAYFSNTRLNYKSIIGSMNFTPRLDSVTFIDYRSTTPDTLSLAQLRIPLDESFGRRLFFADSSKYESNTAFQSFFKGFAVHPAMETDGMISFDMVPTGGPNDAGIYVYFLRDSIPAQYRFPLSFASPIVSRLENDYAGSPVEPFINSTEFSDSVAFVQGTEGLFMELEFPNLKGLEDVIVNKAELIIPVANWGNDNPVSFPSALQLYAYYYSTVSNTYFPIDDVVLPSSGTVGVVFGGSLEKGSNGSPDVYRMNLSAFFQEMLKDDRVSEIKDVIYLSASPRPERVSRSVLYGASHPRYPVKLNLTYTTQ